MNGSAVSFVCPQTWSSLGFWSNQSPRLSMMMSLGFGGPGAPSALVLPVLCGITPTGSPHVGSRSEQGPRHFKMPLDQTTR